jgi:hypothetical protein
MTKSETKECVNLARGLWPGATPVQLSTFGESLGVFQYDRALAVIKTAARSEGHEFFNLFKILEGLHADNASYNLRKQEKKNERIVEWARRQYGDYARGFNDHQVLVHHFCKCRGDLEASGKDADGIKMVLGMMMAHAKEAFRQIGYTPEQTRDVMNDMGFDVKAERVPEILHGFVNAEEK